MSKKVLLTILLSIIYHFCYPQLETSVWYFGNNAGLDFKSEKPTILLDGALENWEGVASFSDSLGHLLFNTNGQTIWNREHQVMKNGTDLIGSAGSTECAIIVPWPESKGKYFVFVVAENGIGPLSYSVVDMNLDEGRGAVTEDKNIILEDLVVEKVTAIRHENCKDFWLLTRSTGADNTDEHNPDGSGRSVVEYLVDKDGISLSSRREFVVGSVDYGEVDFFNRIEGDNDNHPMAIGYMRVAPNGKYIACATSALVLVSGVFYSVLDLYRFDAATGEVSPYLSFLDPCQELYGTEFSNDASKLYYSTACQVFQIDLSLGSEEDIINSVTLVGEFDYQHFDIPKVPLDIFPYDYPTFAAYQHALELKTPHAGALQLAINGKIYLAQNNCEYLGVIENPRAKGTACGFNTEGQYLGGRIGQMGLPNFIPSYFLPPNFEVTNNCINKDVTFECTDTRKIDSYLWELADSAGNFISKSTERNFTYSLPKSGSYRISLTIRYGANESSEYRFFKVYDPPLARLPDDVTLCEGEQLLLKPEIEDGAQIKWNDGSNDLERTITQSSELSITVLNPFTQCINNDDIKVTFVKPTEFIFGDDLEYCEGKSVTLNLKLDVDYQSFEWLDNHTNDLTRTFDTQGDYSATLTDVNGCNFTNTINIRCNPLPEIDFKTDDVFCRDSVKVLDCNVIDASYEWSTGETTQSITAKVDGEYWVTVTDKNGCVSTNSIGLQLYSKSEFSLPPDTLICDDQTLALSVSCPDAFDYIWNDGTRGGDIVVQSPGIYRLNVINVCGSRADSIEVTFRYCGEFVFPNIITPNGDGLNDYFKIKGLEWSSGWELSIFNREGRKVYHSPDYRNNWNAPGLSDGVYFYIMERDGERYKGNITVFHK